MVELQQFVRNDCKDKEEFKKVDEIANLLFVQMNSPKVLRAIEKADQPGVSSAKVQAALLEPATSLDFVSEKKGLFSDYAVSALRPDYYRSIGDSGILLEVERGKTTINNMDLLDFWKCHICPSADYLFLMVPKSLRQNLTMRPRNEFSSVVNRLGVFFESKNYTGVRALYVFGY